MRLTPIKPTHEDGHVAIQLSSEYAIQRTKERLLVLLAVSGSDFVPDHVVKRFLCDGQQKRDWKNTAIVTRNSRSGKKHDRVAF
jgi:hypothetical protein